MLFDRDRFCPCRVDELAEVILRFLGRDCLHGLTPAIDLLFLAKVATKAKRFSMRPRSINIFLLDGDPDGIRVAQISMSTIQAIAFRKLQMKQVRATFPELARPGVYLLLGFDEAQPDRLMAYIGESEGVANRLQYHAGNDKGVDSKPFWTETIVLVSKDENLTKSHARYVEARLIADAGLNPRWTLLNSQKASEVGKLPLPDRAAMEEFIDQTKTLVGALGCDLFKVVSGDLTNGNKLEIPTSTTATSVVFSFRGQGFAAQLSITASSEFVVKKGSIARIKTTNTIPKGTIALRSDLLAKGLLAEQDGGLLFTSDYMFSSVSAAAAVVTGAAANGRISWRLPDGKTYAEWEEAENSVPPLSPEQEF